MLKFPSRRAARAAALAVAAAVTLPASASAITIDSFKAGPVPAFDNGLGLPFVPNQSPPAPVFGPPIPPSTSPTPVPVPAPSVVPGSADVNCAYGQVQPGLFVGESVPTWNGQGVPPAAGTTSQNALPVYSTSAPDQPLELATQANVYSDFCIAFRATPSGHPSPLIGGERVKNNVVILPVGVTAAIDDQVKCTEAQYKRHAEGPSGQERFEPNTCPVASQVGTASVRLRVPSPSGDSPLTPGGVATRDSPGRVFALETPPNLAARFGVVLIGGSRYVATGQPAPRNAAAIPDRHTKFYIDVTQQGEATIGLVNQTDELATVVPNASSTITTADPEIRLAPIQLAGAAFRFWGRAADHSVVDAQKADQGRQRMATDFLRLPTTCSKDLTSSLGVTPYGPDEVASPADKTAAASATAGSAVSAPVRLTGCEGLPFDTSFNARLTGDTKPGGYPALEIDIAVPEGHEDLGATEITLPTGVATDLKRVQNACQPASFWAQACDPSTIIGTVSARISGINHDVAGDIHMVKVEGQTLPALGFNFKGRLPLRLSGVTSIDPTGRIVNRFTDLPAIPQRSLQIRLFGGDRGILQLGPADECAVSDFRGVFTGQNGKTDVESIRTECGEAFKASLKGADTRRPYLTFSGAAATGKKVKSIRLTLPAGLTIAKNRIRSGSKIDKLEEAVTGRTTRARLNKKRMRFTIPNPGSNGLRIITRRGTLNTSAKFRQRDNDISVIARIVYTDGTKVNIEVPLKRT